MSDPSPARDTGRWYPDDDDRLTYPEAEQIVTRYINSKEGQRTVVTTTNVLNWAREANTHHNRTRVYDALASRLTETAGTWSGRTAFEITADDTAETDHHPTHE